jgi:hypothetical protein
MRVGDFRGRSGESTRPGLGAERFFLLRPVCPSLEATHDFDVRAGATQRGARKQERFYADFRRCTPSTQIVENASQAVHNALVLEVRIADD